MSARWNEKREIIKRYRITGTMTLLTPARFGGGSGTEQLTDMPLLRDPKTSNPLLPGASVTGAMRAYLQDWELGYEQPAPGNGKSKVQTLFGDVLVSCQG